MAQGALEMIEYRDDPAILVFGDTDPAIDRGRAAAEDAGYRVVAAARVADAAARLALAPPATIYVDLEGLAPEPALAGLLRRVEAQAEQGRAGIVAAPATMIDFVAAHALHSGILHLVDADAEQRRAALRFASARAPERLHDVGREGQAILHQLSEEVGRIAGILASLSDEDEAGPKPPRMLAEEEPLVDAMQIRAIIRARRLRDQFFRGELFADPAWDMLLDLMAARIERSRVAVSSLCIAAAVPATTALRWIKALTDRGVFLRSADPQDGRRVFIELSDEAARSMAAYLHAAQRLAPSAI